MVSDIELAWAAGFFEGEGHFTVRHRGEGWRARFEMGITTTDEDVARRFAEIAECGNLRNTRLRNAKPYWKPQHNWTSSGSNAHAFAERLLPHLGSRRKERYAEILTIIEATMPQPRPCECCAIEFTPTRFARERFCSDRCRDRAKYLRRKYRVSRGHIPGTRP